MVVPGFLASDFPATCPRRYLTACGFRAYGWGLGRNLGARADLFVRLGRQLDRILAESRGPVTLIGWSLGGIYARELAKGRPEDVSMVITLGSPSLSISTQTARGSSMSWSMITRWTIPGIGERRRKAAHADDCDLVAAWWHRSPGQRPRV